MNLILKEIKNKKIWEDFLNEIKEKTFLQSWNWGEFQKSMGNKIWRLGIYEKEKLIVTAFVSKVESKRGKYLLIQHGPIVNCKIQNENCKFEILRFLAEELKKIGKEEKAIFIRIASLLEKNQENKELFKSLNFRKSPMHASAYEATWKLDINLPEEELLKNMRKTTRYLIRQTMKNQEIVVEKSEKLEDLDIYQEITKESAKRQKFIPFSFKYIKKEFEIFSKEKQSLLFLGKYKGRPVAGALIIFWSGIAFYHQAASLSKYAKITIPYLLQWEAIKEAQKRGCFVYDFWGYTDPKKFPNHPWAGPTLFKMGFGGYKKEYLETQDFILSPAYWPNWLFEKLRKTKRGL